MHILDTDTFTLLFQNHRRVVERLQAEPDRDVRTTIITRIEVLRGRFDFLFKAANASQLLEAHDRLLQSEQFLAGIDVLPVSEQTGAVFDYLRTIKGLKKIGRGDLLIASIALAHNAVLVTRNLRHFRLVPNLRLANWVD